MQKNIGGHLAKALERKICESIKCTSHYGLLKGLGREVPIGDMIDACKWKIIHRQ
jgi:hypothetical protein